MITSFAPGKLILSGEHSVVYGKHAIAMAVDRGVTVRLEQCEGPSFCTTDDQKLQEALLSILPKNGVSLSFTSNLPIGRGMGSSAALSIAIQRGLAERNGEHLSFEQEFNRGMILERFFHGNPSGVDHSVSALGTGLLYKKAQEKPYIEQIRIPQIQLVIIDSGSAGNTAEMVRKVAERINQPIIAKTIEKMGDLTIKIAEELQKPAPNHNVLGEMFTTNHRYLQQIGVSNATLDHLVEDSLKLGAYGAKLSGSGGGGVVFALTKTPNNLMEHFLSIGYKAFIANPYKGIL